MGVQPSINPSQSIQNNMGTWNSGNFDNDAAADLVSDQRKKWVKSIKGSTPFSPPSGPAQRLAQGPPSKSKFLAATHFEGKIPSEIVLRLGELLTPKANSAIFLPITVDLA